MIVKLYVYTVDIYFSDPLSWLLFSSKPLGRIGDFGRRSGEGEPTGKEQGHQNLWTQWPIAFSITIQNPRAHAKTYEHLVSIVIYPHQYWYQKHI